MRKLFLLLYQIKTFLIFVILELICLLLIVRYNKYQNVAFLNSSNQLVGTIFKITANIEDYFILKSKNEKITIDYTSLQMQLDSLKQVNSELVKYQSNLQHQLSTFDTTLKSKHPLNQFLVDTSLNFEYIPTKVINNSVLHERNFITLDKGSDAGIDVDMGVICADGVVGKVVSVSRDYATVMSLLNTRSTISSKVVGELGTTKWIPYNHTKAKLIDIERHLKIKPNAPITTSGYNSIYPEGVMIGTVYKAELLKEESHYNIDIQLSTNFKSLYYVYVVKKFKKEEQLKLEAKSYGE